MKNAGCARSFGVRAYGTYYAPEAGAIQAADAGSSVGQRVRQRMERLGRRTTLSRGLGVLAIGLACGCSSTQAVTTATGTTVHSQATTPVGEPNDPSGWLATCLNQARMLVAPAIPTYKPARSAAEVITKLKDDGANLAPDATAYLVTVRDNLDGGGQPVPSSPSLDTEPMWVVVTPTGSNKISDMFQGGPNSPHTSPLDGQPVFVYWLVSDKSGQTFMATQCAMTAPKP